jgi:hypothetical protein
MRDQTAAPSEADGQRLEGRNLLENRRIEDEHESVGRGGSESELDSLHRHGAVGGAGGGVEVGEADGEGVGGVGGRCFRETEQGADHEGDLAFVRPTPADDRLFHPLGGVLVNGQPSPGGSEEGGAAGGAEGDGGTIALDEDDTLEGGAPGLMLPDQFDHFLVNGDKAAGWEEGRGILDDAVGHGAHLGAALFQDGITGTAERRINGQNALAP